MERQNDNSRVHDLKPGDLVSLIYCDAVEEYVFVGKWFEDLVLAPVGQDNEYTLTIMHIDEMLNGLARREIEITEGYYEWYKRP